MTAQQQSSLFCLPPDGVSTARTLAAALGERARIEFARAFTAAMVKSYWREVQTLHCSTLELRCAGPLVSTQLSAQVAMQAKAFGENMKELDVLEAGYRIGCVYTAALPDRYRSSHGAYYTPPVLSTRLIDMATNAGIDWATSRVLDGSCGGAAFLAPVALKMLATYAKPDRQALLDIAQRLRGFEIDPFAAWLSQVLVDTALLSACTRANLQFPRLVETRDSLRHSLHRGERFDLVIGNPPYGRTRLDPPQRTQFKASLYGHANLYGVFTHAALHWIHEQGTIAYVTPTSMLGGQYFKALRGLLAEQAPPTAIDFVTDRSGIFENVLQETMLVVYQRSATRRPAAVHFLQVDENGAANIALSGSFTLPMDGSTPWLIPRIANHASLVERLKVMSARLADYGYEVSTGPLVWNRHKRQFHMHQRPGLYPVIWAESITSSGHFCWSYEKRNHMPWFKPRERDQWVITRFPCVLVQRTTSKEQTRRLIAAEMPASFVKRHNGVIVENHLNMIRPVRRSPLVSAAVITALLQSVVVDTAFRCISGSVAVSAYELESLPLPSVAQAQRLDRMISSGASRAEIEKEIELCYLGLSNATSLTA